MRHNNKGFSLVELIVALAIFAIAGVAVFGFMVNSSRLYQRSNVDVKLQYEQQLAVNQIRDMVVESDKGIYFDSASKTLALYGARKIEGGNKVYPVTAITYDQTQKKLYFGTKEFTAVNEITFADITMEKLLSENVMDFKVDLTKVKNDKVLFEVTFMVGDKQQTVKETVALRNRLVVSNLVDTIWGDDAVVVDSFIQKIAIVRGDKEFTTGERDSIGKYGNSVVVAYSAKVTANEESDREYPVSWSVEGPEGVIVNAEGEVTVSSTVNSGLTFKLYATSVDDPSKSTYIEVEVTEDGNYPESVTLTLGETTDGNGFRTYKLVPTVKYTKGNESSDYNLIIWDNIDSLPDGATFKKEMGELTLGANANGLSITIKAKAKERKADGTVAWGEYTIDVDGIKEFETGTSVKISCAKSLPRGGYVFPTIVFENATHSNYTYNWEVEPYYDEETATFTDSKDSMDTSRFGLISLGINADPMNVNGTHTMETNANRRSVTLNCSPYLNWNKTFKVKVSATATDKDGKVLVATPVIVSVKPVTLTLERYAGEDVEEGDKRPCLTNSEIMYEDWYWSKLNLETQAESAKWEDSRRWFTMKTENLYLTGKETYNTTLTPTYRFYDSAKVLIYPPNVSVMSSSYQATKLLCGFKVQLPNWQNANPRPIYLDYHVTLSDPYRNAVESNVEEFSVIYDFYYPQTN